MQKKEANKSEIVLYLANKLYEGYFFKDDTINYLVDEFKSGKKNILLAVGFVSKDGHAPKSSKIITKDMLRSAKYISDEDLYEEIYKVQGTEKYYDYLEKHEIIEELSIDTYHAFIRLSKRNQRCIVNSIYVPLWDFNKLKNYAIIVSGTSQYAQALKVHGKRNIFSKAKVFFNMVKNYFSKSKYSYRKYEKQLSIFRNKINNLNKKGG